LKFLRYDNVVTSQGLLLSMHTIRKKKSAVFSHVTPSSPQIG